MDIFPPYPAEVRASAHELHDRIVVFDSHVDLPLDFTQADRDGPGQFDLAKAAYGRLSGAALTLHAAVARPTAENVAKGKKQLETLYGIITGMARDFPDRAGIARSPTEFRRLVDEKKFTIVLGFQNAFPLSDVAEIDAWAARGVSQFAFAFIGNNRWADSARPYPFIGGKQRSGGLSQLGKRGVWRLNDLGVLVDVSQLSSEALRDVLAESRAPVVASHSTVRGLLDADRNLTDGELRAIRDGGGVVQIVAFGLYLRALDAAMMERLRAHWTRYGLKAPQSLAAALTVNDPETEDWPEERFWTFLHEFHEILVLEKPTATLRDLGDAIDYAVQRVGIDHVGIASDFNHGGGVIGWTHAGETVNVTAELLSRGYTDDQIAKLWGGNYLHVWQKARDVAGLP